MSAVPPHEQDLLRVAVGGSVDHGKSSLIGRLLLDAEALKGDQLDEVKRGELSHVTDGLRAEREQGITIDVAYRYFSTPRRGFVIADTPGHTRYTRNMVTGASTADLLLLVVDARPPGLTEQSLRHVQLAHLLGIDHLVVAVNKIELVDYEPEAVTAIQHEIAATARRLGLTQATVVPVSALEGDNVVTRSTRTPWYQGPPLLQVLEDAVPRSAAEYSPLRFPVQWIVRDGAYRGLAGQVSGGYLNTGDEVTVLPSGERSRIARIDSFDGPVDHVRGPLSGTVILEDNLDVARGDVLVSTDGAPQPAREVDATLVWLGSESLTPGRRYLLKHLTRRVRATAASLRSVYDVYDDEKGDASELALNEVGEVTLRLATPIVADPYARNRTTGAFILIDELSHDTVAAGLVRETRAQIGSDEEQKSPDVVWHPGKLDRTERWQHLHAKGATVWLTGLPASGKSTISTALEQALVHRGRLAYLLDGDNVRHGLSGDLGFDAASRAENVRRVAHVARFFADAGGIAVVALVSPFAQDRDLARRLHEKAGLPFIEVFVDTPLEECARRDPKGLYARAKAGRLSGLTGEQNPYEPPPAPEVTIKTLEEPVTDAVERLMALLGVVG
ncbi:MAG: adenylyl-sulfate kinase [Solirubrobacteraceae bacterium]|nr:adenylyl-sulfate kinase [Patulibacter sp.]